MRIIFVNEKLGYSSTTSYSYELVTALAARDHEARLCTGGGEFREVFSAAGIDSFLVRFNFFSFRKLLEILRDFKPDLVHSLNLRSLSMARRIGDRLSVPLITTVHHALSKSSSQLGAGRVAGIIAVNEAVRESLVNVQRIQKDVVRVIRSGVATEKFQPGEPPLSAPGRVPVIGSIGRLDPVKGFRYLIAAARIVLDAGKEAHFVICGDGADESNLRRQLKELDLEHCFTLCPPLRDLPELLRNFDIVVVPSLRGGLGNTVLESMAMARPVVASAVGEAIQIVTDGSNGLLVREQDPEALASKLLHLLEYPEEAQRLGETAREWVEKNLALGPMVDATETFYRDVVEARRAEAVR